MVENLLKDRARQMRREPTEAELLKQRGV